MTRASLVVFCAIAAVAVAGDACDDAPSYLGCDGGSCAPCVDCVGLLGLVDECDACEPCMPTCELCWEHLGSTNATNAAAVSLNGTSTDCCLDTCLAEERCLPCEPCVGLLGVVGECDPCEPCTPLCDSCWAGCVDAGPVVDAMAALMVVAGQQKILQSALAAFVAVILAFNVRQAVVWPKAKGLRHVARVCTIAASSIMLASKTVIAAVCLAEAVDHYYLANMVGTLAVKPFTWCMFGCTFAGIFYQVQVADSIEHRSQAQAHGRHVKKACLAGMALVGVGDIGSLVSFHSNSRLIIIGPAVYAFASLGCAVMFSWSEWLMHYHMHGKSGALVARVMYRIAAAVVLGLACTCMLVYQCLALAAILPSTSDLGSMLIFAPTPPWMSDVMMLATLLMYTWIAKPIQRRPIRPSAKSESQFARSTTMTMLTGSKKNIKRSRSSNGLGHAHTHSPRVSPRSIFGIKPKQNIKHSGGGGGVKSIQINPSGTQSPVGERTLKSSKSHTGIISIKMGSVTNSPAASSARSITVGVGELNNISSFMHPANNLMGDRSNISTPMAAAPGAGDDVVELALSHKRPSEEVLRVQRLSTQLE